MAGEMSDHATFLQENHPMKRCWYAIPLCMAMLGAALPAAAGAGKDIKGDIKIDGSSTVYLVSEAVAAAFKKEHPGVNITVGLSGTGGGFKKFSSGEIDIQDASRAITPTEAKKCTANGVKYAEIQIAWDGIAVVVNKDNNWANQLTMAQLKKIWQPENNAKTWKDVDPAWPNEKIDLYGPGPDSGTFDYFTEEVNGKTRVTRKDYNASGDPQTMVQGVSRNKYALAYFGLAYYEANAAKLRDVAISDKNGEYIKPTADTVLSRKYPLSRPLFIYINEKSLGRDDVRTFCQFYLRRNDIVKDVGYIALSTLQHARQRKKLETAIKAAGK
jgi:phosphate transport system substrate-binding protein